MNLIGNAFKYTQSGFVEISLSKGKTSSSSLASSNSSQRTTTITPVAHLTVIDTGCGISPFFLKNRLFEPFSQEDPLSEGVGLGLPIVRQLVNSLGGRIDVESTRGVGTKVDVQIPIREPDALPRESQPRNQREEEPNRNKESRSPTSTTTHVSLIGFNDYPDLKEEPTGILSVEARRKLCIQGSLTSALSTLRWCDVTFAQSLDKAHGGDVAVIEEKSIKQAMEKPELATSLHDILLGSNFKFFVLLTTGNDSVFCSNLPANAVCVSLPYVLLPFEG